MTSLINKILFVGGIFGTLGIGGLKSFGQITKDTLGHLQYKSNKFAPRILEIIDRNKDFIPDEYILTEDLQNIALRLTFQDNNYDGKVDFLVTSKINLNKEYIYAGFGGVSGWEWINNFKSISFDYGIDIPISYGKYYLNCDKDYFKNKFGLD